MRSPQLSRRCPNGTPAPRWPAALLLMATILFFPVLILVMMVDAVTHDMPKVRQLAGRIGHIVHSSAQAALRLPRTIRNGWQMPGIPRSEVSTPS